MFKNPTIIATVSFVILFAFSTIASAQGLSTSKGRTNAITLSNDEDNYRAIKKIRNLINEGKYESAAKRAIRYIKTSEGNERSGIEKTDLVKEAYNSLCVSSTALGKVEYAMDACNRSLSYNPGHWESLKSRARLYFMTKEYPKSLNDFKLSLENSPNDVISDVLKQNISVVQSKIQ